MQIITRKEVEDLMGKDNALLIEALPEQAYNEGHLPDAVNINVGEVENKAALLPENKAANIVVYCANKACKNSSEVALELTKRGYTNVYKYEDGKAGWQEAGLTLETSRA